MSAAFETLAPDQRAVLQLILRQGRGYAELATLLKIDERAVRARAHAGLDALTPDGVGAALTPERRAQLADWLLGQLPDDEAERAREHLRDSRAARRWVGALHERLAPVAGDRLPAIPGASTEPEPGAARPVATPSPEADRDAAAAVPSDATRPASVADAPSATASPEPVADAPTAWDAPSRPPARRASRLGGALLLGGIALLVAVVAIVLLTGGDDEPTASDAPPAAATQAADASAADDAIDPERATLLQQVNLTPPGGGDRPLGIAFILFQDGRVVTAIQASGMAANGQSDVYTAWLRNRRSGAARFLGYVPELVGEDGRFTVSADLPDDTARFNQLVISRDPITEATPRAPAEIVLQGAVSINRPATG